MKTSAAGSLRNFKLLLNGTPAELRTVLDSPTPGQLGLLVFCIAAGSGLYGSTLGIWRDPLQGWYAALKFPLVIILTVFFNALINGMLAQIMGLGISFLQSSKLILLSFAIASIMLGSLSPVLYFLVYNAPPLASAQRLDGYSTVLLAHVAVIALAGSIGCLRLHRLLLHYAGERSAAGKILFCWLAGNLLLGCQFSWILRPFIGSPELPVQFVRSAAFQGNFYEAVWGSVVNLLH